MAEVRETISIGSKADTRGFKKTESAATKLNKTLKNLAGTFGIVYSTTQLVQYSKASIQAFAQDEKAALSLARTIQNLGLGFESQGAAVNDYISVLEKQTGVLDDELRPAMDRLLRSTLDVKKSQDLLALSLDIAAGTGKSVTQVSQSLQKAYLGQKQAIGRLGVGLSKAELTTASFEDIQKKLAYLFAGQASDAANSYAGQIDRLTIASNNAKETIGKGLVEALIAVSGSGDIDGLVTQMDSFANSIADASKQMAKLIIGFKYFSDPKNIFKSGAALEEVFARIDMGRPLREFNPLNNAVTGYQLDKKQQQEAQRLAAIQAKLLKNAIDAEKKRKAELAKQNALKKAGSVFDQEQIQRIAALKGKLSEEDRIRVQAQLAILNENDVLAKDLTKQILMAQDATGQLYRYFLTIGDAKIKNPFEFLDKWLMDFQEKLNNLKFPSMPTGVAAAVAPVSGAIVGFTPQDMGVIATKGAVQGPQLPSTNVGTLPTGNFTYGQGNPLNTNVYVTVQGSVIAEQDLTETISRNLQNQSLSSGKVAQLERYSGFFL